MAPSLGGERAERLANMLFGANYGGRSRRALLSMSIARFEYFLTVLQQRFISPQETTVSCKRIVAIRRYLRTKVTRRYLRILNFNQVVYTLSDNLQGIALG